jgi:hypothetical protein
MNHHEGHEAHEGLQNEALYSVLQLHHVKINQQPYGNACDSHVSKNLCVMDGEERFDSLGFYEQFAVYEHIKSVAAVEKNFLVTERLGKLHLELNARYRELMRQTNSVC